MIHPSFLCPGSVSFFWDGSTRTTRITSFTRLTKKNKRISYQISLKTGERKNHSETII